MDGDALVVASVVLVQLVAWPLVGLLVLRTLRPATDGGARPVLPLLTTAGLLAVTSLQVVVPGEPLWVTTAWFVLVPVLGATYPDGRCVPRWAAPVVLAVVTVPVVDLTLGGTLSSAPGWFWFPSLSLVAVVVAQVVRYRRRATTAERLAVRWVVLGLLVQPAGFVLIGLWFGWSSIGGPGPVETVLAHLAGVAAPLGFAVGLLRPQVADVDRLLHAVVVALVVAVPAGAVFALGREVAAGAGDGRAGAVAAAAAVVAALALVPPARRAAGWLVHRGRVDPATAVRDLAGVLDAEPDPAAVPHAFLACVVRAGHLDGARLDGPGILTAEVGTVVPQVVPTTVPLVYLGSWLADLTVAPRRGETALTARDRDVVATLARHGAPALHGAVVLADLVDARSDLVRAHEEERRRLRHDLHDDLGPALSGLALGAAALARRARDVDPVLHALGDELVDDIQGAVERTRALARDLRPAVLDDLGLAAAVRDRVRVLAGDSLSVQVEAPDPLDLPAAVDLAALRIVQEAVTNVHRHATARTCRVGLRLADGVLHVLVDDDGTGLPPTLRPGVGLDSIRQRAAELGGGVRLGRSDLGGARVSVRLPVGVAP